MSKKNSFRAPATTREQQPMMGGDKTHPVLLCPFCNPTHPLGIGPENPCGTIINVTAVQTVYKAKLNPGMTCVRCKQAGGTMVKYLQGFAHTHECVKGLVLLPFIPEDNRFARFVFNMKDGKLKEFLQRKNGIAQPIREIDPQGNETEKILGHFFYKPQVNNGT